MNRGDAKERILDAAVRLFARQGYAGTGMRELAKEADVNLAMTNYYFGSKLGLLQAVFDLYFDKHLAVVQEVLAADLPPEARIRAALHRLIHMFRDNPDLVRVTFTELPFEHPEVAAYKADRIREMIQPVLQMLLPVLRERSPRPVAPQVLAPAMIGMPVFHFLMRPVLERVFAADFDDAFYDTYADQLADMFLYGLFGTVNNPGVS